MSVTESSAEKDVPASSLRMAFLRREQLLQQPLAWQQQMLGVTCFQTPFLKAPQPFPYAPVSTPVLMGDAHMCEVWLCDQKMQDGQAGIIHYRQSTDWLFGVMVLREADRPASENTSALQLATEEAYSAMFELMDTAQYPHLLRVWNYIADINIEQANLERYRQFNIGRQDAFLAHRRGVTGSVPAACALGSVQQGDDPHLVVYFLAGKQAARAIENPRQLSAYAYPKDYGPRSPTFSRAGLVQHGKQQLILISGTASIVGHATVHHDDVVAQTEETLVNLQAVLDEANRAQATQHFTLRDLVLKVYVRHPSDTSRIRDVITQRIGQPAHLLFLQADVCRHDLLVEIEATAGHALEQF